MIQFFQSLAGSHTPGLQSKDLMTLLTEPVYHPSVPTQSNQLAVHKQVIVLGNRTYYRAC